MTINCYFRLKLAEFAINTLDLDIPNIRDRSGNTLLHIYMHWSKKDCKLRTTPNFTYVLSLLLKYNVNPFLLDNSVSKK